MLEASEDKFLGETINNPQSPTTGKSKLGFVLGAVTGGTALALTAICAPFVLPALRRVCLPYVPATDNQVSNVLKALKGRSGNFIDLGSGDGRIVSFYIRFNYERLASFSLKFDLYCGLTLFSLRFWLLLEMVSKLQEWSSILGLYFTHESFPTKRSMEIRSANVSKCRDIRCARNAGSTLEKMPDLEEKLKKELCDGGAVVACRFPFPNLSPDIVIGSGIDTVWLYYKKMKQKT
ncbi:hypothetical protein J437_LFUL000577 [Ladona fulva]|uniref:Uncharacterized protein n=1 Tax=Ladona fulva TaxID=123851 RepID=A0A8K0JVU8_LADFU|nr:hypothetical protein J437_LFUL000577 [Ladona fulva]